MASWFRRQKVGVQSTIVSSLIGVLPTLIVSVFIAYWTIKVQTDLANSQLKQAERFAIRDSIRARRESERDSIQGVQDSLLNKIQLDLAVAKRNDELKANKTTEQLTANQLKVAQTQLTIAERGYKSVAIENLLKLGNTVDKVGSLLEDSLDQFYHGQGMEATEKLLLLLRSEVDNPILLEDSSQLKQWYAMIDFLTLSLILHRNVRLGTYSFKFNQSTTIEQTATRRDVINFFQIMIKFYDRELIKYIGIPSRYSILLKRLKEIHEIN